MDPKEKKKHGSPPNHGPPVERSEKKQLPRKSNHERFDANRTYFGFSDCHKTVRSPAVTRARVKLTASILQLWFDPPSWQRKKNSEMAMDEQPRSLGGAALATKSRDVDVVLARAPGTSIGDLAPTLAEVRANELPQRSQSSLRESPRAVIICPRRNRQSRVQPRSLCAVSQSLLEFSIYATDPGMRRAKP